MQFLSDFNDFLATCTKGIQLITGDFNVHYEDKNRPETKKFLNILHQHDFTQLVVSLGKTLYYTFPCLVVLASSSKLQ